MKKVTLIVRQTEISRIFPEGFQLMLDDNASALDAIKAADKEIKTNAEHFQLRDLKASSTWFTIPTKKDFTSSCNSYICNV